MADGHAHQHDGAALADHRGRLAAVLGIIVAVLVVEVVGALIGVLIIPRTLRMLRDRRRAARVDLEGPGPRRRPRPHPAARTCPRRARSARQPGRDRHAGAEAHVVDESCFHDGHLGAMLDELQASIAADLDVTLSTIQFETAGHASHEHETHA